MASGISRKLYVHGMWLEKDEAEDKAEHHVTLLHLLDEWLSHRTIKDQA